jgi:hypothetical protein
VLKLRKGTVAAVESVDGRVARVLVRLDGADDERPAVAYPGLTGMVREGDEVIVNTEALDLGLGSGGFDVVHVNLSRLPKGGPENAHVMKLNYTPIQHAVRPVEDGLERLERPLALPVCVLAVHGQLAPAAFALSDAAPGLRTGYVQTAGGALPGALSDTVAALRERGAIAEHVTAAPCFGGTHEAITVEGALHAGAAALGWDCALVGPGPGILGSSSALGHGGLAALGSAHAALSLGCEVVVAPRLSSGDPRERHLGLSHHTATVLHLLLVSVRVAFPAPLDGPAAEALEDALSAGPGHEPMHVAVSGLLESYSETGLPARTMGRALAEDRDFFAAALAGGAALAEVAREGSRAS